MNYTLIFHDLVEADLDAAYEWYENKQEGLGERFLIELVACYAQLEIHPEYYSKAGKTVRKILLKHFPYIVVFEIIKDTVFVYTVLHTSRNPREIRKRMK